MSNPQKSTAATAPAVPNASASAPAAAATATAAPAKFDPSKAKVLKLLTLPLIKLRAGLTIYIKALEPMFVAKANKKEEKGDDGEPRKPPTLMHVLDLESGELAQIIPGTILADIFNDDYPNQTYVGRGFKIVVGEQKSVQGGGGKRYNQYTVAEIELPA